MINTTILIYPFRNRLFNFIGVNVEKILNNYPRCYVLIILYFIHYLVIKSINYLALKPRSQKLRFPRNIFLNVKNY